MDNVVSSSMRQFSEDTLIGGSMLSLVTSGMYTNPLAIYREYLQNSADSIASSHKLKNGVIRITTDPRKLSVTIRDNGPGLSYKDALRELIPISRSRKHPDRNRGFRGIGRLAGLAFGKSVTFLTRSDKKSPVTRVLWDGSLLRKAVTNKLPAREIISNCATIEKIPGDDYPSNFFEVKIEGISRYAAASILNRNIVRDYVGEVCPVPFGKDFPYVTNISNLFRKSRPLTLDVYLDEENIPITRPHQDNLLFSESKLDRFVEFEEIQVPSLANKGHAAVGWIAHSSYFGALPKKLGVRCLRVRVGNIQIGDETVFDHLFSESRFNRWCVGEIHITDPRILPNARRDYFEAGVHLRNLENHLGAVCRKLEQRCRTASKRRNQQRNFQAFLNSLEVTHELATSGYLTASAAREFINEQLAQAADFKEKNKSIALNANGRKLAALETKLANFRASPGQVSLSGVNASDVSAYRQIFKILAETAPSPWVAKETIETILKYNSK